MTTNNSVSTIDILFARSEQMGLQPTWVLQGRLFAMRTEDGEQYVDAASMNPQTSGGLTKNKLLTRLIMERHNLPNIPYLNPKNRAEASRFLAEHGKIIVKPLKGTDSFDVHIVESEDQLDGKELTEYILEKYIAGREIRFLVLGGRVIGVHRSDYGVSVEQTRDLARISFPQTDWDQSLVDMSLRIARILNLQYAGVDYLIDSDGTIHVLEVNCAPGMKWFHAPTSGPAVDVAGLFLESVLGGQRAEKLLTPVN